MLTIIENFTSINTVGSPIARSSDLLSFPDIRIRIQDEIFLQQSNVDRLENETFSFR